MRSREWSHASCRRVLALAAVVAIAVSCGGGGGSDGGGGGPGASTGPDAYVPDPEMPGMGVDLVLNEADDLILVAVDDERRHYAFFGARGPDGFVECFEQLTLHVWYEGDVTEHYLTIEFDEHQRPVRASLINSGEEVLLAYGSGEVEIASYGWEGLLGVSRVPDPFDLSGAVAPSSGMCAPLAELEQKALFFGFIRACTNDAKPQVLVRRRSISSPNFPAAVWLPKVNPFVDPMDTKYTHEFRYSFGVPNPVYAEWREACIAQKLENAALTGGGIVSGVVGLALSIRGFAESILEYAADGTSNNAEQELLNKFIDKLGEKAAAGIPLSTYVQEVSDYLARGGHGPCSEHAWEFKRSIALGKQEIFCLYGSVQKMQDFTPPVFLDGVGDLLGAETAHFDFTQECCTAVPAKVRVWHEPASPHYLDTVVVRAQMIPPAAGCELTFRVLFQSCPTCSDYSVPVTTNGLGQASISIPGSSTYDRTYPVRTAVQVEGGPLKEYVGSTVNSVWWDWRKN